MTRYDTVVIGAGTAGLVTACHLARAGQKVVVIAQGMGAMLLASGCVDVLGFHPAEATEPVTDPVGRLDEFMAARPEHPYNVIGKARVEAGINAFLALANDAGLDYQGSANRNWLLPSGAGAVHPTCLAPSSLVKGDLSSGKSMLIAGFRELRDFFPSLISQNLNAQDLGVTADFTTLDIAIPLAGQDNATPIELANAFDKPDFRRQVAAMLKSQAKKFDRIGFPAALGLHHHAEVVADLEKQLGRPVFEISALPPSVPGRRLYDALKQALLAAGGRIIIGSKVADGQIENGQVTQIRMETSNRLKPVKAKNYVLATGGIFGGGIFADSEGNVTETIFGLPVLADTNRHRWFDKHFISPQGQPVFGFGLKVNDRLNPVNGGSEPLAGNLFAAGAVIAGSEWTRGRTGDGIAVASAAAIAAQLATSK
ncbi:MAG: glycerol-3-phosphate dehydrogenase subunit GlpB [Anaerolineae bacterium]